MRNTGSLRVAVVGAGIIGLSAALELRARGADVAVYESGTELGAGATVRAAGMLGAAFEWAIEADQRALAALARHAGMLWPDFAARIARNGGGGIEFSDEGAIVIARSDAEIEWLETLAAACQARELPVRRMSAADLKREEPALTGVVKAALMLPEDRQVDAQITLQRLGAALSRAGVGLRFGRRVERIVGGQVFQMPDGERFDRVVLATGMGSLPAFVGPRGAPLEHGLVAAVPVKGQMLALAPVDGGPRHVIHTRDIYIVPKSRWVLVGATSERGLADTVVDPAKIAALKVRAADVVAVLGSAPEVTAWAGVRPGTPDDAPMIGQTAIPGVFAALGHYRNGVLFAPATAELVADQVIDGKVSPLAAAFDPLRFDKQDEAPHSP
ncbi:MAG TPA: FAD-dependent oxidoreductase [Hyphomonadaceae bacterium]|nr:FAD-dependent oxidoreductase [Hyphomonadaceae bacterium]HPI48429.1 FAD-dependent oxidoreductase [Hyphomonadaceae bacterium]